MSKEGILLAEKATSGLNGAWQSIAGWPFQSSSGVRS